MKFTKMQGLGNDYVYVNCLDEDVENPASVARMVSDRHFGIGSDGLILIRPSTKADFFMEMFNADGSRSAMCGNGIRCVGKYVYDRGLTDKTEIAVNTLAGVKYLSLHVENGVVARVTVDMGAPQLEAALIPVDVSYAQAGAPDVQAGASDVQAAAPDTQAGASAAQNALKALGVAQSVVAATIEVDGTGYRMTCVSMGNPHAVMFVEDTASFPVEKVGRAFEFHEAFPERVNAEFIQVLNRGEVNMRVWERGTGETLACGTGACASVVACILNGLTDDEVTVHLLGGDLRIRWDKELNKVFMTGVAATVFDGEIDVSECGADRPPHMVDPAW